MSNSGKWLKTSFFWLLVTLVVVIIILFVFRSPSNVSQVNVSTILTHVKQDMDNTQKDTLTVSGNILTLTRGTASEAPKEAATINDSFDITRVLKDNGIDYSNTSLLVLQYDSPSPLLGWLGSLIGFIPFLLLGVLLIFMFRQAQ